MAGKRDLCKPVKWKACCKGSLCKERDRWEIDFLLSSRTCWVVAAGMSAGLMHYWWLLDYSQCSYFRTKECKYAFEYQRKGGSEKDETASALERVWECVCHRDSKVMEMETDERAKKETRINITHPGHYFESNAVEFWSLTSTTHSRLSSWCKC